MAVNNPTAPSGSKPNAIIGWIEAHPAIAIVGGLVIAIVAGSVFLKGKQPPGVASTPGTGTGDLSGLPTDANGNPIVYVPTNDSFLNQVINKDSYNGAGATTTTTTNNPPPVVVPPVVVPPPPPPRHDGGDTDHHQGKPKGPPVKVKPPHIVVPPVIPVDPPPHGYGGGHMSPPYMPPTPLPPVHPPLGSPVHTPTPSPIVKPPHIVKSGDSIYGIAHANNTSWHAIYTQNKSVIDAGAAQSGHLHPGGPWENLVPGTALSIPA